MSDDTSSSKSSKTKSISSARQKKKRATEGDYVQLAFELFGELRRDIFSNDLMYFCESQDRWVPVLSDFPRAQLRVAARLNDFFNFSAIDDFILSHTAKCKSSFLCRIPKWDGVKRLEHLAECLPCSNLSKGAVYELLLDWGVKMFARLKNPMIQNRILVLKGKQGIGKDHLVRSVLGGLGQFLRPFVITKEERDQFQQLTSGLVMHIAEFDRTSTQEVSQLKNLITMPYAFFRPAYGRKFEDHQIRASFISTCNVDVLRDYTGNRRYIIFDLDDLLWAYPEDESAQFLAEWLHHWKAGFSTSEDTERQLSDYLVPHTPEDPDDEVEEYYAALMAEKEVFGLSDSQGWKAGELADVFEKLSKSDGRAPKTLRTVIKRRGYSLRRSDTVYYFKTKDFHQA